MQEPCDLLGLLLASQARVVALEARVAELTRPKDPADYGLHIPFTPTERAIACTLLPPGQVMHLSAIVGRVWPEDTEAGIVDETWHSSRVHLSRMRTRLLVARSGWRIPQGNGHGEYVLLEPGMPLPAGFREMGAWREGTAVGVVRTCPECDGPKSVEARRCIACEHRARARVAEARAPRRAECPACGGQKEPDSVRCWPCFAAVGGRQPLPACAECGLEVSRGATRCRACEQARRRRSPRRHPYWDATAADPRPAGHGSHPWRTA